MALTGIVNLADRLVNQSQPQTEQSSADSTPTTAQGSSTSKSSAASVASTTAADEFTSSAQTPAAGATAQAAGLFSVATFSLFTAAAKFLLGDSGSGSSAAPAAKSPAVATAANSTIDPSAQNATSVPSSGNSPAIATPTNANNAPALATASPVNSTASNLPFSTSSATPGTTALALIPPSSVAQSASVNSELQSLNTALSALGLPQSDIAVIDRIAALLKDFSPAAYSDLLHQFETLAQSQLAPAATAPPATTSATATAAPASEPSSPQTNLSTANPAPAVANGAIGAVPKGSSASGATFQVQDLVIRFTSITETQTNNTQSSPRNATNSKAISGDNSTSLAQVNVLNLGVEEISVALNNSLGQRAHVHVARSGSNKNSTNSSLVSSIPLAKSANA